MDLTNFIYDFNLATTLTSTDVYEQCTIVNSGRQKEIEYKDSVSLYEIVDRFNRAYQAYTLELDKLKMIFSKLGKEVIYGYHSLSEGFAWLILDVLNPNEEVFDGRRAVVNFINRSGDEYFVNADNGERRFSKDFRSKGVDMDKESIKTCLDIVREHDLFLEAFRELRNKFVFGNGTTVVFSKVGGDVLDKLTTFTLSFGNSYMNSSDFLEIKFRLGKNLRILYGSSKVAIEDEEINDKDEKKRIIDELLRSIFINSEKLCGLYKVKENEKILEKRNNDEI